MKLRRSAKSGRFVTVQATAAQPAGTVTENRAHPLPKCPHCGQKVTIHLEKG